MWRSERAPVQPAADKSNLNVELSKFVGAANNSRNLIII